MSNKKHFIKLTGLTAIFFLIVSFNTVMKEKDKKNQYGQISSSEKAKPHIVFLITEDSLNYEAHKTIPVFAEFLKKQKGYDITVLLGKGTHGAYTYPDFDVVEKADLLVVFARRIALPHEQMSILKKYINSGRPLIGIRTANHAFTMMGEEAKDGFEYWPEFVSSVLGCQNRGYGPVEPGTDVSIDMKATQHPILDGIASHWHSNGNVYKVAPLLDSSITVLLYGKVGEITEPIAWIRHAGSSKIFYTSLGYPTDFQTDNFVKLILGAIKWTLSK